MEKILQQILEGQYKLIEEQKKLAEEQKKFAEEQKKLTEEQKKTNQRLENVEGQVKENNVFIQALIHRTDELEAKFDGLLHTTATKDSINTLNTKFDLLNDRLFQQETELRLLKTAR